MRQFRLPGSCAISIFCAISISCAICHGAVRWVEVSGSAWRAGTGCEGCEFSLVHTLREIAGDFAVWPPESLFWLQRFWSTCSLWQSSVPSHEGKGIGGRWSRAHSFLRLWVLRVGQQWEHTQALAHSHTNTALSLLLTFSRHKWAHARFRDWISVQREYYTARGT